MQQVSAITSNEFNFNGRKIEAQQILSRETFSWLKLVKTKEFEQLQWINDEFLLSWSHVVIDIACRPEVLDPNPHATAATGPILQFDTRSLIVEVPQAGARYIYVF